MNKALIVTIMALAVTLTGVTYYVQQQTQQSQKPDLYYQSQWQQWKLLNKPQYKLGEITLRYKIFKENLDFIDTHNSEGHSYSLALNQFADKTNAEFKSVRYHGLKKPSQLLNSEVAYLDTVDVPASIDWRTKGAVTAVKDQGQCGSCWAFSTTGSLEGLNYILNNKLLSFSEQQLVDCAGGKYGNEGCNGGLMEEALQYAADHGITTEAQYKYKAVDGTCVYKTSESAFKSGGYKSVPKNNLQQFQAAVAKQPVSISIEADSNSFQFYSKGVYDDAKCGTSLDHGVLAVGYGTQGGKDYWIVKNSWAASWGDKGYILIARSSGNGICGINMDNCYPTK